MAQEIEKFEAQAKEIQSHTGNLQGKSREELLQMFKELTVKIGDTDKLINDEKKSLEYVQNQIKLVTERESDLHTERGQKYLKLLQREKDMKAYIQSFPDNLEKTKKDIEDAQRRIVDILGQTSRDLESIKELPSIENFTKMKSDLQYKERQMADAQSTSIALQGEVERRRRELADLQNVDKKIEAEITTLKTKMENMEAEMPKFEEVSQVRSEGEARKKAKVEEKDLLKEQLHHLKKAVNKLATRYNDNKTKIRENEMITKLHTIEKKEVRARAQENYALQDLIEENRRKTNYGIVKRASMGIVAEINQML